MTSQHSAEIGFIKTSPSGKVSPTILRVSVANESDSSFVIDTLADAFTHDPTWSWAFPDPAHRSLLWNMSVKGAVRHSWVFKTDGFEAVSVWIPPDAEEFTKEDEADLPNMLKKLVGERAPDVEELFNRFGSSHPRNEPHYYLSLLGTKTSQRGNGIGMALLRENLARIDALHMPAYLESSNPINNHRYESVGFKPVTSFRSPDDTITVTGMWRTRQT